MELQLTRKCPGIRSTGWRHQRDPGARSRGGTHGGPCLSLQDVDSCYIDRTELQAKADILMQEVDFLKALYDAVKEAVFLTSRLSHSRTVLPSVEERCPGMAAGNGFSPLRCFPSAVGERNLF